MYPVKDPLTLIETRAKSALDKIEKELADGTINSQTDLVAAIESAWKTVFIETNTQIDIPDFRVGELPLASMLIDPWTQVEESINEEWTEWENLRHLLGDDYNRLKAEVVGIDSLIGTVTTKTTQFALGSSDTIDRFVWASDSFLGYDYIDQDHTTAFVDTKSGVITLSVDSLDIIDSQISNLVVDKQNSVGIPGNNLEVKDPGQAGLPEANPEPSPILYGDPDPHTSLTALFDNQPNTWFEWETNFLPQVQKLIKLRSAYVYDSAGGKEEDILNITGKKGWGWKRYILWPGDTNWDKGPDGDGYWIADFINQRLARFVFTITLSNPNTLSLIQLIPKTFGATYPIVESILISSDGQRWEEIASNVRLDSHINEAVPAGKAGVPEGNYTGTGLFFIPTKVPIQYIKISLKASDFYTPQNGFGHHYYVKFTQETVKHSGFFGIGASSKTWVQDTREPNPEEGLVTAPPGQGVDTKSLFTIAGAAIGSAIPGVGTVIGGLVGSFVGSIIGGLFSTKHESKFLSSEDHYDIFNGQRSVIGISDIELSRRVYSQSSQIISKQLTFSRPLAGAAIIVTEDIPQDWDHNMRWINYYLSVDGTTWKSILPENLATGDQTSIILNGEQNLYFRAELTRPSDKTEETSVLKAYAIKGIPR